MILNIPRVKQYMARRLFTVKDLADVYGCSRQRMQIILTTQKHSVITMGKLARALDCDVTDILQDDES